MGQESLLFWGQQIAVKTACSASVTSPYGTLHAAYGITQVLGAWEMNIQVSSAGELDKWKQCLNRHFSSL